MRPSCCEAYRNLSSPVLSTTDGSNASLNVKFKDFANYWLEQACHLSDLSWPWAGSSVGLVFKGELVGRRVIGAWRSTPWHSSAQSRKRHSGRTDRSCLSSSPGNNLSYWRTYSTYLIFSMSNVTINVAKLFFSMVLPGQSARLVEVAVADPSVSFIPNLFSTQCLVAVKS